MKAINLTFKENSDDEKLLNWIGTHSNKSGFIKDILRKQMLLEEHKEKKVLRGFLQLDDDSEL